MPSLMNVLLLLSKDIFTNTQFCKSASRHIESVPEIMPHLFISYLIRLTGKQSSDWLLGHDEILLDKIPLKKGNLGYNIK